MAEFDRESFKKVFDFTDEDVKKVVKVANGQFEHTDKDKQV